MICRNSVRISVFLAVVNKAVITHEWRQRVIGARALSRLTYHAAHRGRTRRVRNYWERPHLPGEASPNRIAREGGL